MECWYLKVLTLFSWMPRQSYPIFLLHSTCTPCYPYIFSHLYLHTPSSSHPFPLLYLCTSCCSYLSLWSTCTHNPLLTFSLHSARTPHPIPVFPTILPGHTVLSLSFPSFVPVHTIIFPSFLLVYLCTSSYPFLSSLFILTTHCVDAMTFFFSLL